MLNEHYAAEIMQALTVLPDEKVVEARDFVFFLKDRYCQQHTEEQNIDDSDDWTDEDMHEATAVMIKRAAQMV